MFPTVGTADLFLINISRFCYEMSFERFNVNKNPTDATVCRYLFTENLRDMFRVSQHPLSRVLKIVPAASGTGHTTCTATPLQRGLIGTGLCESHATRTNQFLILLMMGAVTPETCSVDLQ